MCEFCALEDQHIGNILSLALFHEDGPYPNLKELVAYGFTVNPVIDFTVVVDHIQDLIGMWVRKVSGRSIVRRYPAAAPLASLVRPCVIS